MTKLDVKGGVPAGLGHNQPPKGIETTYTPAAKNAAELERGFHDLHISLAEFADLGGTSITAGLALQAADLACLGTPQLRDHFGFGGIESKRPVEGKAVILDFNMAGIGEGSEFKSFYDQIRGEFPRWLDDDDASDPSVRALLPQACRKGVLVALGHAKVCWFKKAKKGQRITPQEHGTPVDTKDFDSKGCVKAIGVYAKTLAETIHKTVQEPKSDKQTRVEGTAEPNPSKAWYYLSTPVAEALYALHVEHATEDRVERDAAGWLIGLKRERGAGQAQPGLATVVGQAIAVASELTHGDTPTAKAVEALTERLNNDAVKVDAVMLARMAIMFQGAAVKFSTTYTVENPPPYETAKAYAEAADYLESILKIGFDDSGEAVTMMLPNKDGKQTVITIRNGKVAIKAA